ncbi:DUF3718 domain-containing protein [Pseudoalteromonas sp. G4]|uniref:DUF3718 domain-containing protein n=1 Tax=Pseudoalteromonas sp. G4 TaxID=2992761 RepID=UPI00237ECAAE|nr:DUF3718 domain-containing protein [Pseudoalteromonas sp. G4]MDE3271943.1 DUF3718 domain-containing protein [Pseudoalteromonas sp. G4]
MKALALTVVSASLLALPTASIAFDKSTIESVLVQACKDVKSNHVYKLRSNLRANHLSTRVISEKLMCNGESVYDFAMTHNADKTAKVLRTGSVSIRDVAYNNSDKIWVWLDE